MSVTTFGRLPTYFARHTAFPTMLGNPKIISKNITPLSVWSNHQPWELVGILHKLVFSNKGGYSRVLTTFDGQSINISMEIQVL